MENKVYNFEANLEIWGKGIVYASSEEDAKEKIKRGDYEELLDMEPQVVKEVWNLEEGYGE